MTGVCSEEGKCRWRCASKTTNVADCMAWYIEEVERSVPKVIVSSEFTDSEIVIELDLLKFTPSDDIIS